jgi:hypothetical protein
LKIKNEKVIPLINLRAKLRITECRVAIKVADSAEFSRNYADSFRVKIRRNTEYFNDNS